MLSETKQERLRQKDTTETNQEFSRMTRGVEQNKARKIETVETSQKRAEEVLSGTKQDLRLRQIETK